MDSSVRLTLTHQPEVYDKALVTAARGNVCIQYNVTVSVPECSMVVLNLYKVKILHPPDLREKVKKKMLILMFITLHSPCK